MSTMPTLTTPRLTLRPFTPEDAAQIQLLANDQRIAKNVPLPHPYTLEHASSFFARNLDEFQNNRGFSLAITLTECSTLIGSIGCRLTPEHARASFGYWIGAPYWNQGYTTEAAAAFIHHLFTDLNLHRITAVHYGNNPASGRVMQKLGMTHEGTFRDHIKQEDTYTDDIHYALLRPQYLAQLHLTPV